LGQVSLHLVLNSDRSAWASGAAPAPGSSRAA